MTKDTIKNLFKHKNGVTLMGFDGLRWVAILGGPFDVILTSYYCMTEWKNFYIRMPDGSQYPKDYT